MTNITLWKQCIKNLPESYRRWFEKEQEYFDRHVAMLHANVLDVGCGTGRSLSYLIGKNDNLYGVDNDPEAVKDARKRFSENPKVSIMMEDARDLPFKDDFFDYVLCISTPANFASFGANPMDFYSEMRRVLKSYGQIVFSVFNEDAFEERMKVYTSIDSKIEEINGTTVRFAVPSGGHVSQQFSKPQLEEIFRHAKLKPEEIVKDGIAYFCRLKKEEN
jgi:SAM-dependent methyltransferase